MSANEIYQWWSVWLAIGGAVVIVAAALLITIIVLAHKIAVLADTAITVGLEIEADTKSIWQLNASKRVAGDLLDGATAIEGNAVAILNAVSKNKNDRVA